MVHATPTAGIRVRPAARADIPLVLQLIRELADYERAADQVVATEASLERYMFGAGVGRGPLVEALIGELDGRPAGFALFFHNFSTWLATAGIYLEDLFVRPAARGRGLGRALLKRLAEIAVERGCGRLEWAVLSWNGPALKFYDALGARPLNDWTYMRLTGEALRRVAGARA
jgi:GNAT superfamily N-acetyltransferase